MPGKSKAAEGILFEPERVLGGKKKTGKRENAGGKTNVNS